MSLLTRIKLVCSDGDDIFLNDGVYGGLMEFMQVPELQPPYRVIRDGKVLAGPTKSWKVFGPTCDPLDVLPRRLDLPVDLRDEDYIEFGTLGAYGIATSTLFNGYGDHAVVPVERGVQRVNVQSAAQFSTAFRTAMATAWVLVLARSLCMAFSA